MKYFKLKKQNKIKTIEISALFGLVLAIILCFCGCFIGSENISKNVLRLHILANSNSQQDQNLKLKVRNEVLKNFNFNHNNNLEESKEYVKNNLQKIEEVAKKTIEKEGFCYPVKAKLKKTYFQTREYDGFSMPAGCYTALRIEIGSAKGKNWWCVMVPSLCVPAANNEKAFKTFNPQEEDLIKKGYKTEIRFKTIEIFKRLFFKS